MSTAKVLAAVQRSKQFKALIESGLKLSSTDRQLANGTLAFTGKVKVGRKTIRQSHCHPGANCQDHSNCETGAERNRYGHGYSCASPLRNRKVIR